MSTRGDSSSQQQQTTREILPPPPPPPPAGAGAGAGAETSDSLRRTSARLSTPRFSPRTSADSTTHSCQQRSVHSPRKSLSPTRSRSRSRTRSRSCSPPPPLPQCWAVSWNGDSEEYIREALPTPKSLQVCLDGWCSSTSTNDVRSSPPPPAAGEIGIANVTKDHALGTNTTSEGQGGGVGGGGGRRRRPRLILRGMAPAFLRVLLLDSSKKLGIDAEFVEAHAARRRYQPSSSLLRRRGRRGDDYDPASAEPLAAAQWNYPELVGGFGRDIWSRGGRGGRSARVEDSVLPIGDVVGRTAVRPVSDCEDLAAAECRVSVWVADEVDVLFLDLPVWEDPRNSLTKGRRKKMTVTMMEGEEEEAATTTSEKLWDAFCREQEGKEGEEISSLEDILQETLSRSADAQGRKLVDILEEAAYDKWLDLFEVLTPRQSPLIADGTSLEWRALQALEGNLDMAKQFSHHRRQAPSYALPDWSSLIQRLRDRAALLATIPLRPPISYSPSTVRRERRKPDTFHTDNFTNLPIPPRRRPRSPRTPAKSGDGGGGSDPNQRALDRVTYLGGILLPISITSSVLSMNEDFEPGQPLFWVFWAAAVPLTILTFVVIYADKLRSAEVWEEIGSLGSSGGSVLGAYPAAAAAAEEKVEAEIGTGRIPLKTTKRRRNRMHEEAGYRPEQERWKSSTRHRRPKLARIPTTAYAGQDEVVIDLSDVVEQPLRPLSLLEPRTSSQQQQQQQQQQPDQDMSPRPLSPPIVIDNDGEDEEDDYDDLEDDDDDVMDPDMYISRPTNGTRPHAWRKKQLGWAGAAKCMLGMQRPLRVEDGLPVAPGQRRDIERRLRQVKRRASVEGRRSLSF